MARELGVSRRTLYNWIEAGQLERELDEAPVRYSPRPPVPRKLDRFRPIVEARLSEFPRLIATRLFDEIHAAGYAGGYTQLKEYVRQARPVPAIDPVVRFETPPGHQGQVDFAEFRLPARRHGSASPAQGANSPPLAPAAACRPASPPRGIRPP